MFRLDPRRSTASRIVSVWNLVTNHDLRQAVTHVGILSLDVTRNMQEVGFRLHMQEVGCRLNKQEVGFRLHMQEVGCRLHMQEVGCRLNMQEMGCRLNRPFKTGLHM